MNPNIVQNIENVKTVEFVSTSLVSENIKNLITSTPLVETWHKMDDTHLALVYDISTYTDAGSSADVSSNVGNLTLTTDGTGTDAAGLATMAASIFRADSPSLEAPVALTSIAAVKYEFGFFKDANEYAMLVADISVDGNWHLMTDDAAATGPVDYDTGIAFSTSKTLLRINSDSDGVITAAIDNAVLPTTGQITADGHKILLRVTEQAAAAKVAVVKYLVFNEAK